MNIDKMNVVLEDQGCGDLPGVVISPVEEGHQQHSEQARNLVSRSQEKLGRGLDKDKEKVIKKLLKVWLVSTIKLCCLMGFSPLLRSCSACPECKAELHR